MIGSVTQMQAEMLTAEKGRRKRAERERAAREMEQAGRPRREMTGETPAMTGAHEAAEAEMAAGEHDRADKARLGEEVEPGPGSFREPGQIGAEQFTRGYIDSGHAAPSPMHQMPCAAPLPTQRPGVLTPVQLPGVPTVTGSGPGVQSIAEHSVRAMVSSPVTNPPMHGH